MLKVGVVIFPGSNCDLDAIRAVETVMNVKAVPLWHQDNTIDTDAVILPGGFSYGDYLRPGAIASHSPIMQAVKIYASNGGPVIGICNGFQILTESGLLPGTLLRNTTTRFISRDVSLLVTSNQTPFTKGFAVGQKVTFPIAHKDGNYQADPSTLQTLQENNQIVFQYVENPNGSLHDIAGISNKERNVVGLMPHPERALSDWTRTSDGVPLFQSLLSHLEAHV
ncbi:MAG: phosphoribosylformylglycinamidine synthase subunit PurQ [Caldisericia bacterium]|nr:phosphoribosylformylglycinamidine synthase subunit PurQ [Caldisericia bacterium]MDD4614374.1 phosphoribosylformylglycinamidine synthase subunit PurQ [Caldisericia bacterium]